MMHEVASTLMQHGLDKTIRDVPVALAYEGNKQLPLGRYLRRKLRTMIGREVNAPADEEKEKTLQELRTLAWNCKTPLSKVLEEKTKGRRIQLEAREKRKRRDLI